MNRIILTFIAIVCLATSAYSQSGIDTEVACKSRLGITITPLYAYLERINTADDPDIDEVIELFNNIEEARLGYAIGLGFQFPLSNKLSLDVGLQFAQKSRQIVSEGSGWWPDSNYISDISKISSIYNTHHLDFPVGVHVDMGNKKLSWMVGAGVTTSVHLDETYVQKIKYNSGETDRDSRKSSFNYNTFNFSPYAKFGIQYAISDRVQFEITPILQYGVTRTIDNQPISARMWHAGMQVGCYFVCL